MNQKFQANVTERDEVAYVKVSGVIDEDNDLGQLADRVAGSTAVIDLSEVERINSCGVRDWVNWLGKVEKKGAGVVLVECSPAIVAQINLVNNFTGGGVVKSFYAPYFCPTCDREKQLLVDASSFQGQTKFKAPICRCDECDGVMDFDDMEESYFAFLAHARKPSHDLRVEQLLSELGSSDDRKLRGRGNAVSKPGATPIGGPGAGTGPGSLPSIPSLPSANRTPSSSSGPLGTNPGTGSSGMRWPRGPEDLPRTSSPAPQPAKSTGAWILVGVLVITALALLAYVFLGGQKRETTATSSVGLLGPR